MTGIVDCKSGKGDNCVEKGRLDVNVNGPSAGNQDLGLGTTFTARTNTNFQQILEQGDVDNGAIAESLRGTIKANVANVSIYTTPNVTAKTDLPLSKSGLGLTNGISISGKNGNSIYGETSTSCGTVTDHKLPKLSNTTWTVGVKLPLKPFWGS